MLDPQVVDAIKTFVVFGGLSMTVATAGVKAVIRALLKLAPGAPEPNWPGYVASALASVGFTAVYLLSTHAFGLVPFLGYSVLVFASTNVIFKSIH